MGFTSLENQYISASFGQLVQISGSALGDGNGAELSSSVLEITASHAIQANSVTSASHAVSADSADSAISASYAATASVLLGSVVSSSYADNALSSSYATFAQNADEANDLVITVKNVSGGTLAIGTAVHPVGVTGENIQVVTASADEPSNMPAIAVLSQEISNNASGTAIINGRLIGINTANLIAGAPVYVSNGGSFTAIKPTGSSLIQNIGTAAKINASEGEIILQGSGRANDVPNIPQGQAWVGNASGVATPTNTSSFVVTTANTASYVAGANVVGTVASATSASHALFADSAGDLVSTARLNITDITASNATFTSASIGYLQTITGSAKIIGDAFIILNNNTPTERYAGVKVQDSGSAGVTASFQFDGQTNDWFYEYTGSDPLNFGVTMFGPEYGTKGSPTYLTNNKLPKGDGGHHLNDSNITDDGSTVTVNAGTTTNFAINGAASPAQYGNIQIYTNESSYPGNIYVAYQINNGSGFDAQLEITSYSGLDGSNPVYRLRGGADNGTDGNTIISSDTSTGFAKHHKQSIFQSPVTMSGALSASAASFGVRSTSDFVYIDGNEQDALEVIGSVFMGSVSQRSGNPYNSFVQGEFNTLAGGGTGNMAIIGARQSSATGNTQHGVIAGGLSNTVTESERFFIGGGDTNAISTSNNSAIIGGTNNTIAAGHTGSVILGGGSITSDAADTVYVPHFKVSGNSTFTGSAVFNISSLSIASTTASMDCSSANAFTLTLAAGADTHLDATNIQSGQVINLQVTQDAVTPGTISFAPEFKFPGGTVFTGSTSASNIDVLTFISFDGTNLLSTGLKNFS